MYYSVVDAQRKFQYGSLGFHKALYMYRKLTLLFLFLLLSMLCVSVVNGIGATENQFKYVCVVFDQDGDKVAFKGSVDEERFQILFKDCCLANYERVKIPKDAVIFGVFAITNGGEILIMPLYTWRQGKYDYCACRVGPSRKSLSFGFKVRGDKSVFLKTIEKVISRRYNLVKEVTWDLNSLGSQCVSIGRCQRDNLLLLLQINKLLFAKGEPILVKVKFVNTGDKCILVPAMLPFRSSANPPAIEIRNSSGQMASSISGIPKNILNGSKIVLHPGKEIVVFSADLTNLSGFIHSELTPDGWGKTEEVDSLCLWLRQGVYTISASFAPMPVCSTRTEELVFRIEEDER